MSWQKCKYLKRGGGFPRALPPFAGMQMLWGNCKYWLDSDGGSFHNPLTLWEMASHIYWVYIEHRTLCDLNCESLPLFACSKKGWFAFFKLFSILPRIFFGRVGDTASSKPKEVKTRGIMFGADKLVDKKIFGYAFRYGNDEVD